MIDNERLPEYVKVGAVVEVIYRGTVTIVGPVGFKMEGNDPGSMRIMISPLETIRPRIELIKAAPVDGSEAT